MGGLFYVGKSCHLHGKIGMWSEEEVVHAAEGGRTLCGRRVGSEKKGWFKHDRIYKPTAADMLANPTKPSNRFGEGCCRACAKILAKREETERARDFR